MAEVTALSFRPGNSILHRLDVRFKILFVILISLTSLKAWVPGLSVLTFVLMIALMRTGLDLKSALKTLRYVFFLLLLVFMVRSLSVPGSAVIEFKFVSVTREGLLDGALVCWRLAVVIMTGLSLILTTRPSEIKAAVEWALNPVPLIPGKRIATMMSLIVRFVPVIFEQAKETLAAQRARGVENRKNPLYRLKMFGIPLMRRIFERADKLALAMEARCYSENRTDPRLSFDLWDWLALLGVVCLCVIAVL
ncbi:MAG: energy-coupling factor transporter transmembrane component T [Desulfobacterales bacterium]